MKITGIKKVSRFEYKGDRSIVIEIQFDEQNDTAKENRYGTIDAGYLTNGVLNRPLNLVQMCGAKSIARAIEIRKMAVDMKGMTDAEKMEYLRAKVEGGAI